MKIRVLGAGWYGCHIAAELLGDGHEVELHESAPRIFAGASGNIPARLHIGCHYPRSAATRRACLEHKAAFLDRYGHLTAPVPCNIYAIADGMSYIDFDQYVATLKGEIEFLTIDDPGEFGLRNVEGAIQVGERHIVTAKAIKFFETLLADVIKLDMPRDAAREEDFDWTVDCTFCANDSAGVDRFEPCLVVMLFGDTSRAVTIMDGPFPSLYPWDEGRRLCSLSSALWTPFSKTCRTYAEAAELLEGLSGEDIGKQAAEMVDQMAGFYPAVRNFTVADRRLSIRAMPLSGADTRLCDVRVEGSTIHVRAGKIDAVIHAGEAIRKALA